MFEIGFSEILIIAVIALLVLGPEKLPKAARFAGLWVRRARAQWYSVKAEFERELAQEDLRRSLVEPLAGIATEADAQMRALGSAARAPFESAAQDLNHAAGASDVQGIDALRAATAPAHDGTGATMHDPDPAPMHDPVPAPAQDPQAPAPHDPAPALPRDPPPVVPQDPPPVAPRDPAAPPA